jgi:predicted dehydrogenase
MPNLTRRTFSKLSAMALAATRLGAAQTGQADQPVGFAPVGLGSISSIFMQAGKTSKKAKIAGLVTGHPQEKGPNFGAMYNVPQSSVYTYETYNRIRDNKAIDAVYIGLPNSMHCEYTVRAAEAGKHVLCEKPMAISSAECRRMIDACRSANVKLMVAYRIHYDPLWQQALQIVRSGGIGKIEAFDGAFPGIQRAGAWRLDRKLAGGGSVMDLGIYPLNAISYLMDAQPTGFQSQVATLDHDGRFGQMEESIQWTMRYPSGALATCASSYGQAGRSYLKVFGSEGTLEMSPAFNYDGLVLTARTRSGPVDVPSTAKAPYQFTLEADHFADCIRHNREPMTGGQMGLDDMLAIETIYKTAGTPIA